MSQSFFPMLFKKNLSWVPRTCRGQDMSHQKVFTNDPPTTSSHWRQDWNSHPCGDISPILTTWINLLLVLKYSSQPRFRLQHQCFWAHCSSFIHNLLQCQVSQQNSKTLLTGILYVQSSSFLKTKQKKKQKQNGD